MYYVCLFGGDGEKDECIGGLYLAGIEDTTTRMGMYVVELFLAPHTNQHTDLYFLHYNIAQIQHI